MTEKEIKLIIGSLLHDVGKVIYRQGNDRRKHSQSGHDYLKEEIKITDKDILHCVKYHHADSLPTAKLNDDELSYIVYMADNIAASTDRRKNDRGDYGFEKTMPLQSIFNILNGNHQEFYYKPGILKDNGEISFPQKEKIPFDETFYAQVKHSLTENLKDMEWSIEYVNSLLEVLETMLSYVPSSTAKGELADISLYDHAKVTAAVSSCMYQFLQENNITDYKTVLWKKGQEFYKEKVFLLFSMDISGIQDFIYTIVSKGALRTLRARSFYLEIMMEHMIDSLLERLHLSRANLLYCGGGHCYMLLPNTESVKKSIQCYQNELKKWFLNYYKTELYVAMGYVSCNADSLQNTPEGSYTQLFQDLGREISRNKGHRYTAEDIIELNHFQEKDYSRECKVCKHIGRVDKDGVCELCRKIEKFSQNVLCAKFFTIIRTEENQDLPLPGGYSLVVDNEDSLRKRMKEDPEFIRAYSKNKRFIGKYIATKVWVGDYTTGQSFEELAKTSEGIQRIGVLRADVDNLGQTFVGGFDNKYTTISRTAALSRQLSLFFKLHINYLLQNPGYHVWGDKVKQGRNAAIIYSGGDDVFLVGSWNDVVELAVDLRRNLERYTQNTLTISGGIGVYDDKYPVHVIADEVGDMEDKSKKLPGKNAITFMEDGEEHTEADQVISDGTYSWKIFEDEVIGEKYRIIAEFFDGTDDRGNSFLYHLLELIRNQEEKINFARYVYLLARLEPEQKEGKEKIEAYRRFSANMFRWVQSEKNRRQLKTAIQMYVYSKREGGITRAD